MGEEEEEEDVPKSKPSSQISVSKSTDKDNESKSVKDNSQKKGGEDRTLERKDSVEAREDTGEQFDDKSNMKFAKEYGIKPQTYPLMHGQNEFLF